MAWHRGRMALLAALLLPGVAGGGMAAAVMAQQIVLPERPGKAQLLATCTRCHEAALIVAQPRTPDEWREVMAVMIGHGAQMSDADYEAILAYLAGLSAPPVVIGQPPPS